jgi:hypothetical protein
MYFFYAALGLLLCGVLFLWFKKNSSMTKVKKYRCPNCRKPFSDSIFHYIGPLSKEEFGSLDNFQKRFVKFKIECAECGSIVFCTKEGEPFKGYFKMEI